MGWASNFAQIHDAILEFEAGNDTVIDQFWGIAMPNPLPSRGARVRVRGTYAHRFTKATQGSMEDAVMGILTYESVTTLEPAPDKASLPGMKRKGR
jgi:hypothetical protein